MRNSQVIKAWENGHRGESWTGSLSTDGVSLYSYALLIARGREVFDYTSGGLGFISMTTSHHVGMAKRVVQEESEDN